MGQISSFPNLMASCDPKGDQTVTRVISNDSIIYHKRLQDSQSGIQ